MPAKDGMAETSNVIVTLAPGNEKYRTDGRCDGSNDIFDNDAWESKSYEDDKNYIGNIISQNGRVYREEFRFPKEYWEPVLILGDAMIDVHIPGYSKLPEKECLDAYNYAISFFREYFPEFDFKGFMCSSWLIEPNLKFVLPPSSNILKFQSYYHPYCSSKGDINTIDNVFLLPHGSSLDNAPRETSLQRAILDHIKAGWRFDGAWGYFMTDELMQRLELCKKVQKSTKNTIKKGIEKWQR